MRTYHVISAKRMGWTKPDETYDYFIFPTDKCSKEEAIAAFVPVEKWTEKNGHTVPYTAYEYNGELFYSIIYSGIVSEKELNL